EWRGADAETFVVLQHQSNAGAGIGGGCAGEGPECAAHGHSGAVWGDCADLGEHSGDYCRGHSITGVTERLNPAGCAGTILQPLTLAVSSQLLPVYGQAPM